MFWNGSTASEGVAGRGAEDDVDIDKDREPVVSPSLQPIDAHGSLFGSTQVYASLPGYVYRAGDVALGH
jgi:hypothetical protein